jgi:hypothetical protein
MPDETLSLADYVRNVENYQKQDVKVSGKIVGWEYGSSIKFSLDGFLTLTAVALCGFILKPRDLILTLRDNKEKNCMTSFYFHECFFIFSKGHEKRAQELTDILGNSKDGTQEITVTSYADKLPKYPGCFVTTKEQRYFLKSIEKKEMRLDLY